MSDNGRNEIDLSPEERIGYLESLLEVYEPWVDQAPVFVQYLDDEDPQVRATALRGIWYVSDPGLIDRLFEMAEQDPSEMVRAQAVSALGIYIHLGVMAEYRADLGPMTELLREDELPEVDFDRVKVFLLAVCADENRSLDERRYAVEALAFLGAEVADLIREAYNRPEKEMKISALFAMGRSGMVNWNDIVARELYNADSDIQMEAIRAAGEIGLAELGQELWRLTYAEDKDIMLEAIEALGKSGWEEAFERLDELTLDPDPEVSQVAEDALDEWMLMSQILNEDDELGPDLDWDDLY
jgi:HEAT repeat protein